MANEGQTGVDVDQFILKYIDTVPHLESLLLMWANGNRAWSVDEMAHRLFLPSEAAREILEDLSMQHFAAATGQPGYYRYNSDPGRDRLLASVNAAYRKELIRVSGLIHSKPSAAVRAFARAFRVKRDRE